MLQKKRNSRYKPGRSGDLPGFSICGGGDSGFGAENVGKLGGGCKTAFQSDAGKGQLWIQIHQKPGPFDAGIEDILVG